jgi:hypothetical protein
MISRIVAVSLIIAGCAKPDGALNADSARRAVDEFYSWYVPVQKQTGNAFMRAIHERPTLFSAELAAALRADSTASAQSPNEVVGIDGDPFLNAQDPCERYSSDGVAEAGGRYLVQVAGSGGCLAHTTADITVEVTPTNGKLVFTNFIYSSRDKDNLISLLAYLDSTRKAPKPKP